MLIYYVCFSVLLAEYVRSRVCLLLLLCWWLALSFISSDLEIERNQHCIKKSCYNYKSHFVSSNLRACSNRYYCSRSMSGLEIISNLKVSFFWIVNRINYCSQKPTYSSNLILQSNLKIKRKQKIHSSIYNKSLK